PGDSAEFSFSTLLYDTSDVDGILCTWTSKGSDFDITNDTTCINVSINVNSGIADINLKRGHSAYPNPVSDHLTIEFDNPEFNSFELVVYDLIGRNWMEIKNITGDHYFIKAETLPSGLYLYSLKGKGKTFNGRFFVN
ncbi:MAG TPA: T9SS type A sorting domain-containing protein, partial [Bacteroidetes bacterium]|nr:T9SS type A sorting domain-containing protein [Bacteroidota bacterium]